MEPDPPTINLDYREVLSRFSELSAWTLLENVSSAARIFEARPAAGDSSAKTLILAVENDDRIAGALEEFIGWTLAAYRCPEAKLLFAAQVDPSISPKTLDEFHNLKIRGEYSSMTAETLADFAPKVSEGGRRRAFLLHDEPHVIELVQGPLQVLVSLTN